MQVPLLAEVEVCRQTPYQGRKFHILQFRSLNIKKIIKTDKRGGEVDS